VALINASIIIISYNTNKDTLNCLASIFRETKNISFEIIVFDNGSLDNSAIAIQQEFGSRVNLITAESNIGFAVGNNIAAHYAKGEYLLLLNPDTVVLQGAIDNLLEFAISQPDAGIWGGRTLLGDMSLNPASCWMRQTLWSLTSQVLGLSSIFRKSTLFNPEGIGSWNREGVREVDIVSGCFFLVRHDLWKQLNGFHPEFFMYGEEADFCLRAKNLGYQPAVSSAATIVHFGGASEKVKSDKMVRLIKAKILLIKRHFPASQRKLGIILLTGWPITRYLSHLFLSLCGRSSSIIKRNEWKSVWSRRREWLSD
jgi:N-acetylglucosaminyl-diphospho-decaprenol L-rhamnosyltransferase